MGVKWPIDPPVYPLAREAFKRALRTGHGRALVQAENYDVSQYRNEILEAGTTCLVYDTQIDGYREWWLAKLCKAAGLIETIIDLTPDDSSENREQRACLLKEFCLGGNLAAIPRLYEICRRPQGADSVEACSELIEIEGERGLVFAARRYGQALLDDADFWVDGSELWRFDDLHGTGKAKEILSEFALVDPVIRHYLQESDKTGTTARMRTKPKTVDSVGIILELARSSQTPKSRLRRWGNTATREDRAHVAKLLVSESRPIVLVNALCCLANSGLPDFDETLLGLVFHEDEDVRFHAARVFSNHQEPQVRLAGLALLKGGDISLGIKLLQRSAENEDTESILSSLSSLVVEEDIHAIVSDLVGLSEKNDRVRGSAILIYIYEHSPCMQCRERAVEMLLKREQCPRWILEEGLNDASEEIRLLATSFGAFPPVNSPNPSLAKPRHAG